MKLSALTLLILNLNLLLDTGKYDNISIDEVLIEIDKGTILKYLQDRTQRDIDLSIHMKSDTYGDFESFYVKHLQSLYDAYAGNENRKWGVKNKGLCLLIAWTNEVIQQGSGWKPNNNISER
jgi:hypothetical protein